MDYELCIMNGTTVAEFTDLNSSDCLHWTGYSAVLAYNTLEFRLHPGQNFKFVYASNNNTIQTTHCAGTRLQLPMKLSTLHNGTGSSVTAPILVFQTYHDNMDSNAHYRHHCALSDCTLLSWSSVKGSESYSS